jgi:hypothetical protein
MATYDTLQVGIGNAPNDAQGDPLRQAFDKINQRFQELRIFVSNRGDWQPNTAYTADPNRDWVIVDGVGYLAASNHTSGATFAADLAAGKWVEADSVQLRADLASTAAGRGAELVGFKQAGAGAVDRTALAKMREAVSAEDFFVAGDASAAQMINRAISAIHQAGGGTVFLTNTNYALTQAGTQPSGRGYCILMKSRVSLKAISPATKLNYLRTNTDCDVIVSESIGDLENLTQELICIENIIVDGGSDSAASGNGFNFWMRKIKNLTLKNCGSIGATNWGFRVEQCDGIDVDVWADHGPDVNADGLHFVDCRNVIGDARIYSEGDDGLVIETLAFDIWNYQIRAIVETPNNAAAGRGFLILHEDELSAAPRNVKNINIDLIAKDCKGQAFVIDGAGNFSRINANIQSENCLNAMAFVIGQGAIAGSLKESSFSVQDENSKSTGVVVSVVAGSDVDGNHIKAKIKNPGNGSNGVTLRGNNWRGSIDIDYNPLGQKTSFLYGIDVHGSGNVIDASSKGADKNVYIRAGANENIFRIGKLSSAISADIEVVNGHTSPPVFIGGSMAGGVINPALAKFVGVQGAPSFSMDQLLTGLALSQSQVDSTPGRLMKRGDWGLGGLPPTAGNIDDSTRMTGFFVYNNPTGSLPSGAATQGWLQVFRFDGGSALQLLYENSSTMRHWRRRFTAGSWGSWQGPF